MHRRQFLRAGAAALALPALNRYALGFAGEPPKTRRADRLWLVWQVRSVAPAPGNGRPGRVALRRGHKDARRGRGTGGCPADITKEAAALRRLPGNAAGERPGHRADRHAGPLARPADDRCREAGADVYVQKPISVDVVEGRAMLAAARRHKRVVQVGTQRRSTPHFVEARDRIIRQGKLGRIGLVECYCYYHMRAGGNPPDTAPPEYLDYEMWTGPAPMRPYNPLLHPRTWRSFMEYSNGIVGDMCIHMFDAVRWMLGLGWPTRIASSGGILVEKQSKANIPDTQTASFDYGDLCVTWQHRTWGSEPDPKYPWGATFYGEKGTLKISVFGYDFLPLDGQGKPIHRDVTYEFEQYPEDKTEKDLERHVAPAIRRHMQDFLAAMITRGRPVADIEEGYISTASCILANLAMRLGRTLNWDAEKQQVAGDDEANRLLQRSYRQPWIHP